MHPDSGVSGFLDLCQVPPSTPFGQKKNTIINSISTHDGNTFLATLQGPKLRLTFSVVSTQGIKSKNFAFLRLI